MFRLLRSHCLDLRIAKLQMDFEVAAHNAAKEVFPEAEVRGCRFHPAQAWFRKLGRLGLHSVYNHKTSKTAIWLKSIFGLPGLEPEEVEQFFNQELKSQAPERPAVAAFILYLSQTYITDGANHVGRDYGWGQAHNQYVYIALFVSVICLFRLQFITNRFLTTFLPKPHRNDRETRKKPLQNVMH